LADFTPDEQKELLKKLEGREAFLIPKSLWALVEMMTNEDRGILFTAVFSYGINMESIDLKHKPLVQGALNLFKQDFKRQAKKYLAQCEQNRANVQKRYEKK